MTQQEFFNRYHYNPRADKIGGGSFGTVYKAYDNVLDKYVAIKISEVKSIGGKDFSLMDEFDAIKDLPPHVNIANYEKVYIFEQPNGVYAYAIIQYYPHGNFKALMEARVLSREEKEDLANQLLNGLEFLHNHHVVHRDMKPSNILIHQRQINNIEKIIVKIADFGLSKKAAPGEMSRFTNSFGGGTLEYSSPEQLKAHPLRYNTDLWAWGAIAYELFTGKALFVAEGHSTGSAEKEKDIFEQIINKDISKALEQTHLPANWKQAIAATLVRDPEQRVKNVAAIRTLLAAEQPAAPEQFYTGGTVIVEDKPPVQQAPLPPAKPVETPDRPSPSAPAKAEPTPAPTLKPAAGKKPARKKILIASIVIVLVVAAGIAGWLLLKPGKDSYIKTFEFNGVPGMLISNYTDPGTAINAANGKCIFPAAMNSFFYIMKDSTSIPFFYFHDSLDGYTLNLEIDNNRLFVNGRLKSISIDSLWDWKQLDASQIPNISYISVDKKYKDEANELSNRISSILDINPFIFINFEKESEENYQLLSRTKPYFMILPCSPKQSGTMAYVKTLIIQDEQPKGSLPVSLLEFPDVKNVRTDNLVLARNFLIKNRPESMCIMLRKGESISDLGFLKNVPGLKSLHIYDTESNDRSSSSTSNNDTLPDFRNNNEPARLSLDDIEGFKQLTSFSYNGKGISGNMTKKLTNLTAIKVYNATLVDLLNIAYQNPDLKHFGMSFSGNVWHFDALESLSKLETLCLLEIKDPDAFAREAYLTSFKKLKSLRAIGLPNNVKSDHALYKKFQQACPNAVIYTYDYGMCMGSGWLLLSIPVFCLFLFIKWKREKRAPNTNAI